MVKDTLPKWVMSHLRLDDLARISEAIAKAELKTNAEIVPMVVRRSTLPSNVFWVLFLALLLLVASTSALEFQRPYFSEYFYLVEAAEIILLGLLAVVLSRLEWVQRILTSDHEMDYCVNLRAQNEFYQARLNQCKDATGILIFISLFEHEVVILADQSIAGKLDANAWEGVVQTLTQNIKSKQFSTGLMQAVDDCARIASEYFPPTKNQLNEFADKLVIKD
jgi:putative membrane protein